MTRSLRRLLSPPIFLGWSLGMGRRLWLLSALALVAGVWLAFFVAPSDAAQGEVYRLMFVHVPAAWMSMFIYLVMALHFAAGWVWHTRVSWVLAQALAPVGACHTAIALWTGALWGAPTWGTWWVWDARLTSELVLLMLYLGVAVLPAAFDDAARGRRAAALLAIAGLVNLPIIYFSVIWWNTLHQGATLSPTQGAQLHPSMLHALLVMVVAAWAHAAGSALLRAHTLMQREQDQQDRLDQQQPHAPMATLQPVRGAVP
jgi:heme exporter protein C